MQIVILLLELHERLNQELDITGLPPSFYMNLPELFTRNNKINDQCFRHNFTQKYANRDIIARNYITTQSGTRHNRFASFILYESSRTVY